MSQHFEGAAAALHRFAPAASAFNEPCRPHILYKIEGKYVRDASLLLRRVACFFPCARDKTRIDFKR